MEQAAIREDLLRTKSELQALREILYANIVMAGELPAPTGNEGNLTRFLSDRFTESGLNNIAFDQAGNVTGMIPGRDPRRNILLAAHADKVWPESEDHSVSVGVGRMSARGIADNSVGVATLATLPLILERLGVVLESNIILLGTTRSFGRGDIGGMRFFLENADRQFDAALCLEGMNLGRLSYASIGMARGEVHIESTAPDDSLDVASTGVIARVQEVVCEMIDLNRSSFPDAQLLIGSVKAGSDYNVPPKYGRVRFEIRSESETKVKEMEQAISDRVKRVCQDGSGMKGEVEIIARRRSGDLGSDHPLVAFARSAMEALEVKPKEEPSVSELAALLNHRVPALTLGLTKGRDRHTPHETIELEPLFDGVAHLLGVLKHMDQSNYAPF